MFDSYYLFLISIIFMISFFIAFKGLPEILVIIVLGLGIYTISQLPEKQYKMDMENIRASKENVLSEPIGIVRKIDPISSLLEDKSRIETDDKIYIVKGLFNGSYKNLSFYWVKGRKRGYICNNEITNCYRIVD